MGQEIHYCARCGDRISGEEFDRGQAFRVENRIICSGCIRKELSETRSAPGRVMVLRGYRRLGGRPH
ncbi:MAG TPA: hypothetical protein VE981_09995 [Planctomycetota bacterium]|nr:hypothetical protein [Planctomycetota bacterium]